jgi:hypothetical protein
MGRMDGRTDTHGEASRPFRKFENLPKKVRIVKNLQNKYENK